VTDGQTNRQTDRIAMSISHVGVLTHEKNLAEVRINYEIEIKQLSG